jgi:hypothetical protein
MRKFALLVAILALTIAPSVQAVQLSPSQILWEYDPTVDPLMELGASVVLSGVDSNSFRIQIINTSKIPLLLTGVGFNLPSGQVVGGQITNLGDYVAKKYPDPTWGWDISPIQGPFNDLATLQVNTVFSTLSAAAKDGIFDPTGGKLQGPSDGVLNDNFSLNNYPYFAGSIIIQVDLNQSIGNPEPSHWDSFFRGINNVVVSFGSPNAVVPEPATMLMLGVGLLGIAAIGRRKLLKK